MKKGQAKEEKMTSKLKLNGAFWAVLICAIFISAPGYADGRELVDRVVAVVGGEVITLSEVNEIAANAPDMPAEKVLETLIDEKLIEIEARKKGVEATDSEVEAAIERHIEEMGVSKNEFEALLQQGGLSMDEYRKKVRNDLIKVKFVKSNIQGDVTVTDEDALNYYRRHQEDFRAGEEIHLEHIFLPFPMEADEEQRAQVRALAQKVRAKAMAGEDFTALAKTYSKGGDASSGGDLGWVVPKDLVPAFAEAVKDLKSGQVSEVVELEGGCHLLFAVDRKTAEFMPFEDVKEKIQQYLYSVKIAEQLDKLVSDLKQEIPIERLL